MSHRMPHTIATLLCLTAAAAFADEPRKSESVPKKTGHHPRIASMVEVQPNVVLTDQESSQISLAAGRVLKHVVQARDALREKKNDEAASQVEQGLRLIAIIDNTVPHYKVRTEIKSGDLAYSDEDEVRARYVTLFDELERHDIVSPIAQAKMELQHRHRRHHATESAAKEAPEAVAVTHVDIHHSAAKLDLVLARQMLNRAKHDLQGAKTGEADEALLTLQSNGVLFEYEEIDLPLEEAADNLKLAEAEMKAGRPAEARAALHVAVRQLKRYEKLVGDTRSAAVKALHQEITKLMSILEKGPPTEAELEKMAAQIAEWWQNTTKWFKNQTK